MSRAVRCAIAALLSGAIVQSAAAGTCVISTVPVAFGAYNPIAATPNDTTGSISIVCQPNPVAAMQSYTLSLSSGSAGSFASRRLISGAQGLNYQLYTDAPRTMVWGDGSAGSSTVTSGFVLSVLVPVSAAHVVYARIPASQSTVGAGAYMDTIIVTVVY